MEIKKFNFNYDSKLIRNFITTGYFTDIVYKIYPELYRKKNQIPSKTEITFLKKHYSQNKNDYFWAFLKFQNEWQKIENKILKIILEEFNLKNFADAKVLINQIKCYISLSPGGAFSLDEQMIAVFYKLRTNNKIKVCVHEILHIILYLKWKKLFPNICAADFKYPRPLWQLSEILIVPLINQTDLKDIIDTQEKGHRAFKNARWTNNISYTRYFNNLFKKFKKSDRSFDDFLKKAHLEFEGKCLSEKKLISLSRKIIN